MKKFIALFGLIMCCTTQASETALTWHTYKTITLPEVTQSRLNTKLKLIELVSLRQWNIINPTLDSFDMSLDRCNLKISFTNEAITISQGKLIHTPGSRPKRSNRRPPCTQTWLSNVVKDINTTLRIMSAQQETINLEKAHPIK
ncbi:hypothetical protein VHA01S_024_00280 [Vibrio halioticoli NBRC 102217]|uniref:Uncharacterized protein n=1 Tax=Vibrio halioticoli NBRC 102217 TaxID=1219072 RepID=V5F396_9VIBR|nr:hypothetical protein [Vibrio halioticoli]GAD89634.1 hypothetical protein VHA01S_024_00280 [Vibrio halioticoli NBRC 102217]